MTAAAQQLFALSHSGGMMIQDLLSQLPQLPSFFGTSDSIQARLLYQNLTVQPAGGARAPLTPEATQAIVDAGQRAGVPMDEINRTIGAINQSAAANAARNNDARLT